MDVSISMNEFEVMQVSWLDMEQQLRSIRTRVFIEEQQVPVELEWEEDDVDCVHLLAQMNDNYIATARLLASGQIGRMAVLKPYRQLGVGSEMLKQLLSIAKSMNMSSVFLNAQIEAIDFYKQFGFQEQGDVFDDAGIPHRKMDMSLFK
jgi:predicted GNAT family N-acyltransferase